MRWILIALVAACSSKTEKSPPRPPPPTIRADAVRATAPGQPTDVHVDQRVELISIVQRLAGGDEYRGAPATPYVAEVDRQFAAFRTHPAVRATAALRTQYGISFDAPMILAVHLDDALALRNPDELPALDARWRGVDVDSYAKQLRAFAEASKFTAFFDAHRAHYDAVAARLRGVVEAENPVGFFDELFGPRANTRYVVVPGLLTGHRNFGVRATLPDGTTELYQVLGVATADGLPAADAQTVSLLVHEMAHSYVNPLFERHAAALEPSGTRVFPLVETAMRAQHYTTWSTMWNESGVRAVTVLFMRTRKGDRAGADAARAELRAGFLWINDLVEVFRKCRRDHEGELATCMPDVIAFFDALAQQYAAAPPRPPFIGPVDAIWRHRVVIALPDGKLRDYAMQLPFIRDKQVMSAEAVDLGALVGTGLVAYGTPASNPIVAQAATWGTWKLTDDGIELGAKKLTGKNLVLIACWFRRDDPARGIAVYAAPAGHDADLVGINAIRHGAHDWLVARRTANGFEIVDQGDWPFENGSWIAPFE